MALQTEVDMMLSAQDGISFIPFNLFCIFSHFLLPAIYWNHFFDNHIPKELLKICQYWQQGPIPSLIKSVSQISGIYGSSLSSRNNYAFCSHDSQK